MARSIGFYLATLPANVVMNDGLYTAEQIDRHYEGIEGTLAPLGHPTVNGEFVSAFSPEGINQGHIGAWNRNVKKPEIAFTLKNG